jgi:hypothetical protein
MNFEKKKALTEVQGFLEKDISSIEANYTQVQPIHFR